ncbi:putative membrane protein [Nocardiopsis arvandica]|uniref:Putative membrane protein n=1 Tax=Nocardiopsis sinuspersici TaxID=501010 RepID=A0A7Y9XBS0_9ACTN|nr:putative membrane protein [Nocardiopsis sinuspersici]
MDPQYPARRTWEPRARPQIRLTDAERDDVIGVLQEAFSRGQLDEAEFDERTGKAMRAKFGVDLVPLTEDLGLTPAGAPRSGHAGPFGVFGAQGGQKGTDPDVPLTSTPAERVVAAAGHWGNYFVPVVAPLVVLLLSDRISPYVRRQAMESLNFQIFCIVTGIVSVLLSWLIAPLLVTLAVVVGWTVVPAVAGVAALMGRNWRYPMFRVLKGG